MCEVLFQENLTLDTFCPTNVLVLLAVRQLLRRNRTLLYQTRVVQWTGKDNYYIWSAIDLSSMKKHAVKVCELMFDNSDSICILAVLLIIVIAFVSHPFVLHCTYPC